MCFRVLCIKSLSKASAEVEQKATAQLPLCQDRKEQLPGLRVSIAGHGGHRGPETGAAPMIHIWE